VPGGQAAARVLRHDDVALLAPRPCARGIAVAEPAQRSDRPFSSNHLV